MGQFWPTVIFGYPLVFHGSFLAHAKFRPTLWSSMGQFWPTLIFDQPFGLPWVNFCLLYTSDAADERSSVDLGGRRIIKKKRTESSGFGINPEEVDETIGFFFQAEDGIRDAQESRGLGDVYKRQANPLVFHGSI